MTEPFIKTPWNTRMEPDEFKQYYKEKQESLKRTCDRDGCNNEVEWPRRYCSWRCESYDIRLALHKLFGEPKPTPPEDVPNYTPEEMQEIINDFKFGEY